MPDPRKDIVRRGYDATADAWASARGPGKERAWLPRFIAELRSGANVLDLGCGSGEPIASTLVHAGFAVTGVDLSREQLRIAAQRIPTARLVHADMSELDFAEGSSGGVVAWDSSFHLPPNEQPRLIARVHRWLAEGAPFLFTAGGDGGELHTDHLGKPMYYGSLPLELALRTLADVGFTVVDHVVDEPSPHAHAIVLARR